MNIYWYTPFHGYVEPRLARATLRPEDWLLIHTSPSGFALPAEAPGAWEVVADLPEAHPMPEGTIRWLASRSRILARRSRLREREVDRGRFNIGHIHYLNYFTDGWAVERLRRRLPTIGTVHDVFPHERRVPRPVERLLLSRMYRNSGPLVVAHDRLRRELIERFDVDPSRISVIPLPVREIVARRSPSENGSGTVLFFGTLRRNKGVAALLDAVRRLRDLSDMRVHIAGRGAPEVEEMVLEAARTDQRITAEIGYVTEERRDALFGSAALVVLPYTSFASQSGVLGDAYSYRLPVVVTDVGALGETVRADGSGWVVPPADPAALADALADALGDERARDRAADRAERAALARSYEVVGGALRELYERVAG